MKTRNMSWLGLVAFLTVPVYAADSPAPAASEAAPGPVAQVRRAPAPTPPGLSPKAAEVLKLNAAGVGDEVILAYVNNCQSPFNLSANAILSLKEAGLTSPVIVAMLTHDNSLRNQNAPPPYAYSQSSYAPAEQPPAAPAYAPAEQTPPPTPVEVMPAAPGPDYYWYPGYWGWNGGWIWIGGGWGFRGGYGWGGRYGGGWYGRGSVGGYRGGGIGGYHGGGIGGSHGGGGGGFHGGGGGGHGGGGHGR